MKRGVVIAAALLACGPGGRGTGLDAAIDAPSADTGIATLRPGFHLPGITRVSAGDPLVLASDGTNVFATGYFSQAGEVPGRLAEWSGRWLPMQSFEAVRIAVDATGVLYGAPAYVLCDLCGPPVVWRLDHGISTMLPGYLPTTVERLLPTAQGIIAVGDRGVTRHDGTTWISLGVANDVVRAVAERAGTICVGGDFTTINAVPAAHVACLASGVWTQAGDGIAGTVRALSFASDGRLIAGGHFAVSGGANVATMTAGTWSALGGGTDAVGVVNAIAIDGDAVVAGGSFTTPFPAAARFAGGVWSGVPGGLSSRTGAVAVVDVAVAADGVYLAGQFDVAGGVPAASVARWTSTGVAPLVSPGDTPRGVNGEVNALIEDGSDGIIAAGRFLTAGQLLVHNVARFAGGNWQSFGDLDEQVNVLARRADGTLFAGGGSGSLFQWTGSAWGTVATLGGAIRAMLPVDGDLVLAGDFGPAASNVVRWDGSALVAMGGRIPSPVVTLHRLGDGRLCAGVESAMPLDAARWCWNGTAWQADLTLRGTAYAMAELHDGTELAAGWLTLDGGNVDVARLASTWERVVLDAQGEGGIAPTTSIIPYRDGAFIGNYAYELWWDGVGLAQRLRGATRHSALITPSAVFVGNDVSWQDFDQRGPFAGGFAVWDLSPPP